MRTLTPAERRAFRAKAHHLRPFVSIGQHGVTPAVLHEIAIALAAHELIKIRVFNDDRGEREALLARICEALDAAPVQHLGKILTIWRPAPEPAAPLEKPRKRAPARAGRPGRSEPKGDGRRQGSAAAAPRVKPSARRGAASTLGGEPATRPPRGAGSGTLRRRASSGVGSPAPRGPGPGLRRRRTPR